MNRHCGAMLVTLTASLLFTGALFAAGKPRAVVEETIRDVGRILKGDKMTQEFSIQNGGDAPLEIKAWTSCSCTVAHYDRSIAPGQTGVIRAVVDTTSLSGPVTNTVTLSTNDPNKPQIQFILKGKVEPHVAVKPGYARYTTVQGEPVEGVPQTIWAADGLPFDIERVVSPLPALKITYREAKPEERNQDAPGKQWRLESVLSGEAKAGELSEIVTIRTTHPRQQVVYLPVSGLVRPLIAITPPVADFGTIELGAPQRRSLGVRNFGAEPIRITGVTGNVQGVEVTLEPLEEGRQYQVGVTVNPSLPKGPFEGIVTLLTDSPRVPRIDVELRGTIQ